MAIHPSQLVADVLHAAPATLRVFLAHRMRCIGCPIAQFHTVADACREHSLDAAQVLADLRAAALVAPHGEDVWCNERSELHR
jgi:hybrid cluster-associated redox disulfide protein